MINYSVGVFSANKQKKNHKKDFFKDLIKRFTNIQGFCNGDIKKFILLLSKGVYTYKYMESCKIFDETSLHDKKEFYSSLNMEGITNVDYRHEKRVFKYFNDENIDNYHDLYVQNDTLLLANIFENFRNVTIKIYELDPAQILSLTGFTWVYCLKKHEYN